MTLDKLNISVQIAECEPAGYVAEAEALLPELVSFALTSESAMGEWTIVVVLTNDDHLRQLHRDFMGIDEETDVMTFPYEVEGPADSNGGDIVISVDRAVENADAFRQTPLQEIAFLAVHGTLHLLGWDDRSDVDRARMLERQREIVAAFPGNQISSIEPEQRPA